MEPSNSLNSLSERNRNTRTYNLIGSKCDIFTENRWPALFYD
jgi:hypothetical protein